MLKRIIPPVLTFVIGAASAYFYFRPAPFSATLPIKIAHDLSVSFRKESRFCEIPYNCNTNANFFEMSDGAAVDFTKAVNAIKSDYNSTDPDMPKSYRCIYGFDGTNTKLIIVGLNSGKVDIIDKPNSIQILDNTLGCPIFCDANISLSSVVMGKTTAGENCCK